MTHLVTPHPAGGLLNAWATVRMHALSHSPGLRGRYNLTKNTSAYRHRLLAHAQRQTIVTLNDFLSKNLLLALENNNKKNARGDI